MHIYDDGDGLYPAELSGTYVTDAPNNTITFEEGSQGDTGFILPSGAEWLLVEFYKIDGVEGTTGLTAYSSDVSNISVDIEALRQEAIGYYTSFLFQVTHFLTGDLCDVYTGSAEASATLVEAAYPYTPPVVSWKLTKELTGPFFALDIYSSSFLYDNTNISTEFNTLTDMLTTSNILEATSDSGVATSDQIVESVNIIAGVKNIQGEFSLVNISDSQPVALDKIPTMTSNTSPSGVASASNVYSATFAAWKALDKNSSTTYWSTNNGVATGWFQYQFPSAEVVDRYSIIPFDFDTGPRNYTLLGSNTGAFAGEETLLDTQTGVVWVALVKQVFTINNTTAFLYYRIAVTETLDNKIQMIEFELGTVGSPDLLKTGTQIGDGDNLVIVKDDDSTHEVVASGVVTSYTTRSATGIHTGYYGPWGQAIASSELNTGNRAWEAFDASTSSGWASDNGGGTEYLMYIFNTETTLLDVTMYPDISYTPHDMTYEISDNGTDWEIVRTFTGTTATDVWTPITPLVTKYFKVVMTSSSSTVKGINKLDFTTYDQLGAGITDTHTGYVSTTGTVSTSSYRFSNASYIGWQAFDKTTDGWTSHGLTDEWIKYAFTSPTTFKGISIKTTNDNGPKNSRFEVSDNNIDWTTVLTFVGAAQLATMYYELPSPVTTSYFRLYIVDGWDTTFNTIDEIQFYEADLNSYELDTTSTTLGEAPSRVYKEPKVSINHAQGVETLVKDTSVYTVGTPLLVTTDFIDTEVFASSYITTEVAMVTGNKMTKLGGDIYVEDNTIYSSTVTYDVTNIATEFLA